MCAARTLDEDNKIEINVEEPLFCHTTADCGAFFCAGGTDGNTSTSGLSWPRGYFSNITW